MNDEFDEMFLSLWAAAQDAGCIEQLTSVVQDVERLLGYSRTDHTIVQIFRAAFASRDLQDAFDEWRAGALSSVALAMRLRSVDAVQFIPPSSLYKYRDLSTVQQRAWARDLVCQNELYLASHLYGNDSFDTMPGVDLGTEGGHVATPQDWEKIALVVSRMHIGICSMSSEPLQPNMWAHYANSSRGICVELDGPTIGVFAREQKHIQYELHKVRYVQSPPPVEYHHAIAAARLPAGDPGKRTHHDAFAASLRRSTYYKEPAWSSECEWRLVCWLPFEACGPDHASRRAKISGCVKRVILGSEVSADTEMMVREWCAEASLPPPLRVIVDRLRGRRTLSE